MNKAIFLVFIISLTVTTIFLYFFYRDVILANSNSIVKSCSPSSVEIQDLGKTSFEVKWKTGNECVGYVKYGESIDSLDYTVTDQDETEKKNDHAIKIEDLDPGTSYYLVFYSDGKSYGYEGSPMLVTTKAY